MPAGRYYSAGTFVFTFPLRRELEPSQHKVE